MNYFSATVEFNIVYNVFLEINVMSDDKVEQPIIVKILNYLLYDFEMTAEYICINTAKTLTK